MNISIAFENMFRYISEGVARIFGPNDDQYPDVGVQPFEGDPYKETKTVD